MHGVPLDADFVFDVRTISNPYRLSGSRPTSARPSGLLFAIASSRKRRPLLDLTATEQHQRQA
jgi:RNase adaptor protein for sRNA GlmZ degradation